MLAGTVKYFNINELGGCGILIPDRGDTIYFLGPDRGMVTVIEGACCITPGLIGRLPRTGDRLVYEVTNHRWNQRKAAPWCFEDDWLKAESLARPQQRSQSKPKRASARAS